MTTISNMIGPPVTGADFFGRHKELERARRLLSTGHSLAMSAPRRVGKSSMAHKLLELYKADGWRCVYIDLEGLSSAEDFLRLLIQKFSSSNLWKRAARNTKDSVAQILESLKSIGPLTWDFKAWEHNIYEQPGELLDTAQDTLIVIDELTLFLNSMESESDCAVSSRLLNWLRSLRQIENTRIRWIFCGSVGVHNFTRMRNLTHTVNDMVTFDFDAMTADEAPGLIRPLFASDGIQVEEMIVERMLMAVEWWVPYFIQLQYSYIRETLSASRALTPELVDEMTRNIARSEALTTWSERLWEYNDYEEGARAVLRWTCETPEGLSKAELLTRYADISEFKSSFEAETHLSNVLNMLEHDGYIVRRDGKRAFRSRLLRDWWYWHYVE